MTDRPIIFSAPEVRALLGGRKTQTRRVLPAAHPRFPYSNKIRMDVLAYDPQRPAVWYWDGVHDRVGASYSIRYAPGDRLWVREACRAEELSQPPGERPATKAEREKLGRTRVPVMSELDGADGVRYSADDSWRIIENSPDASERWIDLFHYRGRGKGCIGNTVPSIHMPRWASRLTLTVTEVRVHRLQDISEADAVAEGGDAVQARMYPELGTCRHWYQDLWNSLHGPDAWDANPWVVALTFTVERGNIDLIGGAA